MPVSRNRLKNKKKLPTHWRAHFLANRRACSQTVIFPELAPMPAAATEPHRRAAHEVLVSPDLRGWEIGQRGRQRDLIRTVSAAARKASSHSSSSARGRARSAAGHTSSTASRASSTGGRESAERGHAGSTTGSIVKVQREGREEKEGGELRMKSQQWRFDINSRVSKRTELGSWACCNLEGHSHVSKCLHKWIDRLWSWESIFGDTIKFCPPP